MYRTTEPYDTTFVNDPIHIPKGTLVVSIRRGSKFSSFAVSDPSIIKQLDPFERKYRYIWIPNHIVEYISRPI